MDNIKKKSLFDLTIKGRLIVGFIALVIPLLIVMIITLININSVEHSTRHNLDVSLPTLAGASTLDSTVYATQASLFDYLITGSPQAKTNFGYAWNDIKTQRKQLDELSSKWASVKFAKYWEDLKQMYEPLNTIQTKILNLPNDASGKSAAIPLIENDLRPLRAKIIDLIDGVRSPTTGQREGGMINEEVILVEQSNKNLLSSVVTVKYLSYSLLFITILLSIIITLWTSRAIAGPLNHAIGIAKRIAAGERNIEIIATTHDETGELLKALSLMLNSIRGNEDNIKQNEEKTRKLLENLEKTAATFGAHTSRLATGDLRQRLDIGKEETVLTGLGNDLNAMTEGMADITKKITEVSGNMVTTLEEVKTAANAQSTGITEQAASINEITSSVEEIDKSSKQTIEKARSLGEVAKQTREKGNLGIQSVEQSMEGMRTVREKVQAIAQTILDLSNLTQQVGEITAVVNTLAQQSKMLALNASIEAAKAGEAGKGFAVVAIEVKNLAEQSEQSTAQVQKILEDIRHGAEKAVMVTEEGTKQVDQGSKLIEKASEVIHSLNDMIHDASIASQQIEASIRQEGISIEQINAGMNEINQVTNSFVNNVKETMTSINYLADIAKVLKESISIYKL